MEDVAIIDGGSIPVEIQDEIIYELFFIGNLHVSLEKLEFTDLKVFEKIFGKIVDSKQDSISISDLTSHSLPDLHIVPYSFYSLPFCITFLSPAPLHMRHNLLSESDIISIQILSFLFL